LIKLAEHLNYLIPREFWNTLIKEGKAERLKKLQFSPAARNKPYLFMSACATGRASWADFSGGRELGFQLHRGVPIASRAALGGG